MSAPRRIGNINDAAERYGVDGARVWELICHAIPVTSPDGGRVTLIAPPEDRIAPDWNPDGEATQWVVSEVPVD